MHKNSAAIVAKVRAEYTTYTPDLGTAVCKAAASGKSLRTLTKEPGMPSLGTVFSWIREYPDFARQYQIASQDRAEALFEEIWDICDDGRNDWMATNDPDNPGYRFNGEAVQRSRLRVDTRKWALSKLMPKKYGDKVQVESTQAMPLLDITRYSYEQRQHLRELLEIGLRQERPAIEDECSEAQDGEREDDDEPTRGDST